MSIKKITKVNINGVSYHRENFTKEQLLMDARITELNEKRANIAQELDELTIIIDALINRLVENISTNHPIQSNQNVINPVYNTIK